MPELRVGEHRFTVPPASNLLDALNDAGCAVPYSCRAGSCHACLVRCLDGVPDDAKPEALAADKREQGWRLACQCSVSSDLRLELFDPRRDGVPAKVSELDWFGDVLRLRLRPERPFRYQAGQHLVLWREGVARPYSLASLPGEDDFLEFHLDCRRPGAFCDQARRLQVGDEVRLGELRGGALHYDPEWNDRPLWLLAVGTGIAPLMGVLREALRQGHQGPVRVWHVDDTCYLEQTIVRLAVGNIDLMFSCVSRSQWTTFLNDLQPPRQTIALVCGGPQRVQALTRRLLVAGLARRQVFADAFVRGGSVG
ncbi:iron-sulfur-binding ferredoxin reductase [Pseudomonas sp. UFMG81]|uniref:iron-sulfur-binding ferredoxin reductase n=1 Tax=Pseudomonas sp. UFMG81 TaxID=2745936 RepID=UPI0018900228|nr:iron-sulfur-binding ferredoxin reductase [Pseudomonas sp. UFMG81]